MRIKALEGWDNIPSFAGNRKQKKEEQTVYSFRILSGAQEMDLRQQGIPVFPESLETVITSVKNPPVLVSQAGEEQVATVGDIADRPELKGLYMELVIEYGKHAALDEGSAKN